jgi:hypothetical protein
MFCEIIHLNKIISTKWDTKQGPNRSISDNNFDEASAKGILKEQKLKKKTLQ